MGMSVDAWFADYAAGSFLPDPAPACRILTGHSGDWWDGFSTGITDSLDAFGGDTGQPGDDTGEWLTSPSAVTGYLFVHLVKAGLPLDAGAVRLDRAAEDCQRLLEHLGVEPTAATPASNVLPFAPRQLRGAR